MNNIKKILVVEDSREINEIIKLYLEKTGYKVFSALDGQQALDIFKIEKVDLIILDIMLPKIDGWGVCRAIKKDSNVPIIMLSAKGDTYDKVLGLELGADDYMTKPFEPKELMARVKAVLRRTTNSKEEKNIITIYDLVINRDEFLVHVGEEIVKMPPKEFELLFYLATQKNSVVTRERVLEKIWGYDYFGDTRTVDVHVKRIRNKIEKENAKYSIKSIWGVGYKFEVE